MQPTSASQIKNAQECPRIWGADKLGGIKEPPRDLPGGDPRENGKALHSIGEKYLDGGIMPDLADDMGLRFMQGLPFLPPPGSGGVEGDFLATVGGVKYQLYIDAICPVALVPAPVPRKRESELSFYGRGQAYVEALEGNWTCVIDHKSTKDAKKTLREKDPDTGEYKRIGLYTRKDFLSDPQAMLYAAVALILNPESQGVYLRWVYYSMQGAPYAEARDCAVTRIEVLAAFNRGVQRWAAPLVQLRTRKGELDWRALPANPARCDKYKGRPKKDGTPGNPPCFLSEHCQDVTSTDKALALLSTPEEHEIRMEDLLEQLRAEAKNKPKDPINGVIRKPEVAESDDLLASLGGTTTKEEVKPEPSTKSKPKVTAASTPEAAKALIETRLVHTRDSSSEAPQLAAPTDHMTVRDMFASCALETARHLAGSQVDTIAVAAYAIADAMLKARAS